MQLYNKVNLLFVEDIPLRFVKLKGNKTIYGFSHTQQYIILFYLDDELFRSLGNHYLFCTYLILSLVKTT